MTTWAFAARAAPQSASVAGLGTRTALRCRRANVRLERGSSHSAAW